MIWLIVVKLQLVMENSFTFFFFLFTFFGASTKGFARCECNDPKLSGAVWPRWTDLAQCATTSRPALWDYTTCCEGERQAQVFYTDSLKLEVRIGLSSVFVSVAVSLCLCQ